MIIYGVNPVLEALRAKRVRVVRVADNAGARVGEIVRAAERDGVDVRRVRSGELDREARGGVHQGVAAELAPAAVLDIQDLLGGPSAPLLVVLDGIEDPQNVGAILRTVDAAGADGVIRQSRHAARLDGAAAKASAGAVAHVKVAEVVNIARAVDDLKEAGLWTVGLAADAPKSYDELDLTLPTAIVVGAEGVGLRRLVRDRCDLLASIPMRGHVDSLNVSVATSIVLFEALRQRRARRKGEPQSSS